MSLNVPIKYKQYVQFCRKYEFSGVPTYQLWGRVLVDDVPNWAGTSLVRANVPKLVGTSLVRANVPNLAGTSLVRANVPNLAGTSLVRANVPICVLIVFISRASTSQKKTRHAG